MAPSLNHLSHADSDWAATRSLNNYRSDPSQDISDTGNGGGPTPIGEKKPKKPTDGKEEVPVNHLSDRADRATTCYLNNDDHSQPFTDIGNGGCATSFGEKKTTGGHEDVIVNHHPQADIFQHFTETGNGGGATSIGEKKTTSGHEGVPVNHLSLSDCYNKTPETRVLDKSLSPVSGSDQIVDGSRHLTVLVKDGVKDEMICGKTIQLPDLTCPDNSVLRNVLGDGLKLKPYPTSDHKEEGLIGNPVKATTDIETMACEFMMIYGGKEGASEGRAIALKLAGPDVVVSVKAGDNVNVFVFKADLIAQAIQSSKFFNCFLSDMVVEAVISIISGKIGVVHGFKVDSKRCAKALMKLAADAIVVEYEVVSERGIVLGRDIKSINEEVCAREDKASALRLGFAKLAKMAKELAHHVMVLKNSDKRWILDMVVNACLILGNVTRRVVRNSRVNVSPTGRVSVAIPLASFFTE